MIVVPPMPPRSRRSRRHPWSIYLGVEDVLRLHAEILGCSTQQARDHLRNPEGLEGAVARPLSHAHYAGADLAAQAAVLAHGIAEGQLFVDGNKRTALAAALTFLDLNGLTIAAPQAERAGWILELSSGGTAEDLATHIRAALAPR
jgi:death-on-curing protein